MYKISIILPVYNVENYLKRCFDSLLSQTIGFSNLQVIFVDDSSTDNSREIIDRYSETYENVISLHLSKNSGFAGKPRNEGMKFAFADYLLFLDPDDYLLDNACDILYRKIIESDADIVVGGYKKEDWTAIWHSLIDAKETLIENPKNNLSIYFNPPGLASKLFKKELLLDNNIRFPEKLPAQDLVFLTETYLNSKSVLSLNEIIIFEYCVRTDSENQSVTQKTSKKYLYELLTAYNLVFELFEKFNVNDTLRKIYFTKNHFNFFRVQLKNAKLNEKDLEELFHSKLFLKFRNQKFIRDDEKLDLFFIKLIDNPQNVKGKTLQEICRKTKSEYLSTTTNINEIEYVPAKNKIKYQSPIEEIEKELYYFIKKNAQLYNLIEDSKK